MQQVDDSQVDLVIVFCKGQLDWLDDLSLPAKHRILVYLKCSKSPSIHSFCQELHCIPAMFVDQRDDGAMQSSDECGGYLLHIQRYFDDLSDWTVFLQDDAPRHLHLAYLNMVLKLMASGTFSSLSGEFLHLNNDRHLLYWTPCLDSIMKVLGLPSARLLATYCCSQFVVHRNQILKRGLGFFRKAADLLKNNFEDIAGCNYESNQSSASSMRSEWKIFVDLRQERVAGASQNSENTPRPQHSKWGFVTFTKLSCTMLHLYAAFAQIRICPLLSCRTTVFMFGMKLRVDEMEGCFKSSHVL